MTTTTSISTGSGAIHIAGLPFASNSLTNSTHAAAAGWAGGLAITAGHQVSGLTVPGGATFILYVWDATTGATAMQASEWTDDGAIIFGITYSV